MPCTSTPPIWWRDDLLLRVRSPGVPITRALPVVTDLVRRRSLAALMGDSAVLS